MQFTMQDAAKVTVKARGKFISRAVDVVEVATKRFLENVVVIEGIKTNSEDFETKEGKQIRVSTIELVLTKK